MNKNTKQLIKSIAIIALLILCGFVFSQEKEQKGTFLKPFIEKCDNKECRERGHINKRFCFFKQYTDFDNKTVLKQRKTIFKRYKCLRCCKWIKEENKTEYIIWNNDYYLPIK